MAIMCGGASLADVKVPTVTRKVKKTALWAEKNKPRCGSSGDRRFTGLGEHGGVDLDDNKDYEADFKEFEANSGESDLELGRSKVDEKDDDDEAVEIKPFIAVKRSLSQGIRPGSLGLVFNLCVITFSD